MLKKFFRTKKQAISAIALVLVPLVLYDHGFLKVTNPDNPLFVKSLFSFQNYSDSYRSEKLAHALSKLLKQWQPRTEIDKFFFETGEIERATRSIRKENLKSVPNAIFTVSYLPRMTLIECVIASFTPDNCYYTSITVYYDEDENLLNISVHGKLVFPQVYNKPPKRVLKQVGEHFVVVPLNNLNEGEK